MYICPVIRIQSILTCLLLVSMTVSAQLLPNFGGQRAGLSTLSFLKNDLNPRAMGMSGAGVALEGDVFSSMTNPAGLTSLKSFNLGMSHMLIGAGIQQSLLSAQFKLPNEATVGFQFNSLNSGSMPVRTEFQPNGTGTYFSVSQNALSGNYAVNLSEMFSLGVAVKVIYESMAEYTNTTAGVDVGFLYKTDFRNLRFAVMVQNFGGNSSLSGTSLQIDYNRTSTPELGRYTLPTVFKMGFSMDAWKKDKHKLIAAAELNNPNDNAENIRLGAEYSFADLLKLQTGIKLSVKGQPYPTFGLGFKSRLGVHPLHIQYAINPTSNMGNQHVFGIRLTHNSMTR
jgi:hypothetical protein